MRGAWIFALVLVATPASAQDLAGDSQIGRARGLLGEARHADDRATLLDEGAVKLGQGALRKRVDARELRDHANEGKPENRPRVVAEAESMEVEAAIDEAEQKRLRLRAEELRKSARLMRAEALREARGEGTKQSNAIPPAGSVTNTSSWSYVRKPTTFATMEDRDCGTPFVFNREGIKLFRRECLGAGGATSPPRDPCDPPYEMNALDGRKHFRLECFEGAIAPAKPCDPPFTFSADGVRHAKEECAFDTRR